MAFDREAISVDVAHRLRQLREGQEMSMRALARRSGLSANALSMIERGRVSPSVSTLYKVADALGVSITQFFGEAPSRQNVVLVRANERTRVPFVRGVWEGLGGEQFSSAVEPFVFTLEAGGSSGNSPMSHTGQEFVYCLRGTLEYLVENERLELGPGDSLLFAAHLRHRWKNPGPTVVNALVLLSGFSEARAPHPVPGPAGGKRIRNQETPADISWRLFYTHFARSGVYAYIPQSSAEGSSIIAKSHTSGSISTVTGLSRASTAFSRVISIMAGP